MKINRNSPAHAKFALSVLVTEECWFWLGQRNLQGYGLLTTGNGHPHTLAHRFAYEHFIGPIPQSMIVRHTCDNTRCVNPKHLLTGTRKDNSMDAIARNRLPIGEQKYNAKLTDAQVVEIRSRVSAGEKQRPLIKEFGVSRSVISAVVLHRHRRRA